MSFFSKLKSFLFTDKTNQNYDSFIELKSLTPNSFTGLRTDFTKQLTSSFSITSSLLQSDKFQNFFSISGTIYKPTFFLQTTVDQEKNLQNRIQYRMNQLILKVHTLYSKTSGNFSQVEVNLPFLNGNFGAKIIHPAIKDIQPIYVLNYLNKIKNSYFGIESIFTSERNKRSEVGLGFSFKTLTNKSEFAVTLQQLTALNISFLKKINQKFQTGIDFNYSLVTKECFSNVFFNLNTKRTVIKSQIDNKLRLNTSIEERLADNFMMYLCVESDLVKRNTVIGMGFNLIN